MGNSYHLWFPRLYQLYVANYHIQPQQPLLSLFPYKLSDIVFEKLKIYVKTN